MKIFEKDAAQQKTSTLKRQEKSLFDSKFSVETNGFVSRNMNWLRNIKKSNAGKTYIYVFRGLRVKKVPLKSQALTGGVPQGAFNHGEQFCKIHSKKSALKTIFNKVTCLMACNFIKKKKLRHRCFPVTFPKFLRRPTLQMSERMLE